MKGALIGVAIVAVLWSGKMWLNARDARARAQAEIKLIQEQTAIREKELEVREKSLSEREAAFEVQVVAREQELAQRGAALERAGAGLKQAVRVGMDNIAQQIASSQQEIQQLPPNEINGRFRKELEGLR
jgi:hypothetical protein